MRAGLLDRRVRLESPVETIGALGEVTRTWTPVATVWARRVPQGAAERLIGHELVAEANLLWSLRWRDDVNPKWRLIDSDDRVHRIVSVQEGSGRHEELLVATTIEEPERGS
jgi:SPP1 family predicted phage head-tail adaptor